MTAAMVRARAEIVIISDCQSAVKVLKEILSNGDTTRCWPANDDCGDFWEIIAEQARLSPPQTHAAC